MGRSALGALLLAYLGKRYRKTGFEAGNRRPARLYARTRRHEHDPPQSRRTVSSRFVPKTPIDDLVKPFDIIGDILWQVEVEPEVEKWIDMHPEEE